MSNPKILPALLISILNGYIARPVQAAQLTHNPCPSFSSLNCAADRSLSTDRSDILPTYDQVALAWGDLFKWLGRHEGTKGIRRPNTDPKSFYCLIAPGKLKDRNNPLQTTTSVVWNREPLFLWRGEMNQIQVYAHGKAEPLWTKPLDEKDRSVVYDGDIPLTPNRLGYYWQVEVKYPEKKATSNKTPRMSFLIMPDAPADELDQRLQKIDQRDLSPLEKAKRRIAVFREESYGARNDSALSGDILQELYALKSPSPELERLKSHDFCPDDQQPVTS